MATPVSDDRDKVTRSTRLDGWKDIAAFLGRAERTVKRWETERGVPIHRVPGGAKAPVYAYTSELNQWLESSATRESGTLESAPGAEAPETESQEDGEATETEVASTTAVRIAAPRSDREFRQKRPVAVLVTLSVAGLALAMLAFSAFGNPFRERMHTFFGEAQQKANPGAPPAVSEAEKAQSRSYYLKGRYEWNQRTPESLNRALDLFTQAIVHDPGYAQAYAGLADTYDLLYEYAAMPEKDAFSRAIAAAKKAVELDGTLAEAHRALAYAERYGDWNFMDSEREFHRAIELDPKDAQARRWYGNAFAVSGRFEDSLNQLEKAQELDPSSHATLADKALLLADEGRTGEAIQLLKEVERSAPDFRSPHAYMMRISLSSGDYANFLSEGEKTAETMKDPVLGDIMAAARAGYARGGRTGMLSALYPKQKEHYLEGRFRGTWLAITCVLMGRKQEALQLLEEAYLHHESEVLECLAHPDLLSLRDEPRYKGLVARIKFPLHPNPTTHDFSGVDAPHLASAVPN